MISSANVIVGILKTTHTLVLLAGLVSSEVALGSFLLVLLALVLHLFRQALTEERKVRCLTTLFLKLALELVYALLGGQQTLLGSLPICDSFLLCLLCVRQCATSCTKSLVNVVISSTQLQAHRMPLPELPWHD